MLKPGYDPYPAIGKIHLLVGKPSDGQLKVRFDGEEDIFGESHFTTDREIHKPGVPLAFQRLIIGFLRTVGYRGGGDKILTGHLVCTESSLVEAGNKVFRPLFAQHGHVRNAHRRKNTLENLITEIQGYIKCNYLAGERNIALILLTALCKSLHGSGVV